MRNINNKAEMTAMSKPPEPRRHDNSVHLLPVNRLTTKKQLIWDYGTWYDKLWYLIKHLWHK